MADPAITPNPSPYTPSEQEAQLYLHGVACQHPGYQLIARTSPDIWTEPLQDYGVPLPRKHLSPFGKQTLSSRLWEESVAPALGKYLFKESVLYSSLLPVCIGPGPSYPVIMVAVMPDSLSHVDGLKHAIHCQSILTGHNIHDVYIIIYESVYRPQASLMKPRPALDPVAIVTEPFTTSLGIPISTLPDATRESTGSLFLVNSRAKGPKKVVYMLTTRHGFFPSTDNGHYVYSGTVKDKRKVVLMGNEGFKKYCRAIEIHIAAEKRRIGGREKLLAAAAQEEDEEEAAAERRRVERAHEDATERLGKLQSLLDDVTTNLDTPEKRILGHIVLSPPLAYGVGEECATEDWALVEMDSSVVSKLNFVGNVIDTRSMLSAHLGDAMHPVLSNLRSFKHPESGLLTLAGVVSDQEMAAPNPRNIDRVDFPAIMVIKNGHATGLTVGRLNNMRSADRHYGDIVGTSMEIAVLPRQPDFCKAIPFSDVGDSGSVVVDGEGRVCGILTGGNGPHSRASDITYVTSINFLLKRLADHGIQANIFPLPSDLPQ